MSQISSISAEVSFRRNLAPFSSPVALEASLSLVRKNPLA